DADRRPAEAARQAFDRPPVRAQVEERGGLDDLLLAARQVAEDRLRHRLDGLLAPAEELAEQAAGLPVARLRRERRPSFADPAVCERLVLAERADVDELAPVRREP